MRIKVIQKPHYDESDGIDLRRFIPGQKYEVGNALGALLLAEGWAEPLADDEPALLIPFSDTDPFTPRIIDRNNPPNLVREMYPPYADDTLSLVANLDRRKRLRPPKN